MLAEALRKLSTIIHLRRKQLGLSLRALAKKSDVSSSYISSIEKGINNKCNNPVVPTIEVLVKLAQGLDLSLIELLTMSGFDKVHEKNSIEKSNTINSLDFHEFIKEDSNAEIFKLLVSLKANTTNENLIKLLQSLNNMLPGTVTKSSEKRMEQKPIPLRTYSLFLGGQTTEKIVENR